jgi:hypothetical protein
MPYNTITPDILQMSRDKGLSDDTILDNYLKDPMADPSFTQSYSRVRDGGHRYQYDDGEEIPLSTATLNYAAFKDITAWRSQPKVDTREIPWSQGGAFGNVQEAMTKRTDKMASVAMQAVRGEKTSPEAALQIAGQAAAAVPEVVFGAAKGLAQTPLKILDRITLGFPKAIAQYLGTKIIEDPNVQELLGAVQSGMEKYQEFRTKYPRIAEDLEATANIASLGLSLPAARLVGGALPVTKGALSKAKGLLPTMRGGVTRKAPDIIENIVRPVRSTKELQALYEKSPHLFPTGRQMIGKTSPVLTEQEGILADYLRKNVPELASIGKPLEAGPVLIKRIQTIGGVLDKSIEDSKAILSIKESVGKMRTGVSTAQKSFGEGQGIFNAELQRFARFRKQFPGTLKGERQALLEYDKDVGFRFGKSVFEKGTARAEAVRAVRETSQATLAEGAARVGINTSASIAEMRQLYQVMENLSTQVKPEIFNSWLKTLSSNVLVRTAAQGVGAGTILHALP